MKFNLDKFNSFLENYDDQDIRNFVLKIFNLVTKDDTYDNDTEMKIAFLGLGFYQVEPNDDIDDDQLVFNFYQLSKMHPDFRKIILKNFYKGLKNDNIGDFFENFILNDLKIVVKYKDWIKIERNNKLEYINNN